MARHDPDDDVRRIWWLIFLFILTLAAFIVLLGGTR